MNPIFSCSGVGALSKTAPQQRIAPRRSEACPETGQRADWYSSCGRLPATITSYDETTNPNAGQQCQRHRSTSRDRKNTVRRTQQRTHFRRKISGGTRRTRTTEPPQRSRNRLPKRDLPIRTINHTPRITHQQTTATTRRIPRQKHRHRRRKLGVTQNGQGESGETSGWNEDIEATTESRRAFYLDPAPVHLRNGLCDR